MKRIKNLKLYSIIGIFLLLFPFRLPISVLLIRLFNSIATLAGNNISDNIMCANIVVTKLVYDIILSVWFAYSIETLSIKIKKGPPEETMVFWWTGCIIVALVAYIIYDCITCSELFYLIPIQ